MQDRDRLSWNAVILKSGVNLLFSGSTFRCDCVEADLVELFVRISAFMSVENSDVHVELGLQPCISIRKTSRLNILNSSEYPVRYQSSRYLSTKFSAHP